MNYEHIFNFFSEEDLVQLNFLVKELNWEEGRQKTGYMKAAVPVKEQPIREFIMRSLVALGMDMNEDTAYDSWILKYPEGSSIPPHIDNAPFGSQHWRLNALIQKTDGGRLYLKNRNIDLHQGDAIVFRPDVTEHSVSTIVRGERYIWSVGILK